MEIIIIVIIYLFVTCGYYPRYHGVLNLKDTKSFLIPIIFNIFLSDVIPMCHRASLFLNFSVTNSNERYFPLYSLCKVIACLYNMTVAAACRPRSTRRYWNWVEPLLNKIFFFSSMAAAWTDAKITQS